MNKFFLFLISLTFISLTGFSQPANNKATNDTASYPYWIEMMQNPDANYYQTVRAFDLYWQDKEIVRGSGYKPFKRWQYYWSSRLNQDGTRQLDNKTYNEVTHFISARNGEKERYSGEWTNLGPIAKPDNSGTGQPNGNGRINAIAFHPTSPDYIYIGAPAGGFWISSDGGNSWVSHTDQLPTLGVSSIAIDNTNPNIIYIGTGDRDASDAVGMGVFKSTDGGVTFTPANNNMTSVTVGRLLIHPTTSDYLLAATSAGIYKSTDGAETWTKVKTGNFKDIVFKPNNASIVYATKSGDFYRSEDTGDTWTKIDGTGDHSRGVIGVTESNPNVVYFVTVDGSVYGATYKSVNAGLDWTLKSNSPNIMSWGCNGGNGGQGWYDLDVAVCPTNANTIYVGGVNVFKSTDGGSTWQINSHWVGSCGVPAVHADCHVLEYSSADGKLYAGNDGGIYRTGNGGSNWDEITSGLAISQIYKIGQAATNKDKVMNGYQDNGSATYVGDGFVTVMGGDGMDCAYDHIDDSYAYGEYYNGDGISRIYNNVNQGGISNGIGESGAWVTPIALDVIDPEIMYVGMKNIWRGTNIKSNSVSWQKITTVGSNNVRVIEQSPVNENVFYYCQYNNRFYRSDNLTDSNPDWIDLSVNLPVTGTLTDIEASGDNENVVFITLEHKVFKSVNKGESWEDITLNLPDASLNTIEYYNNDNEGLYVGSDAGIFYKNKSMNEWILYSDGFPLSANVTEIEFFYDSLSPDNDAVRASTYGRGLWSSPTWYGELTADFESSDTLIPLGCKLEFFDKSEGVPHSWLWTFEGATPNTSTVKNPTEIQYNEEGTFKVTLVISNPTGSDTIVKESYITVGGAIKPNVDFTSSYPGICPDNIVEFTDQSANCPTAWLWTFTPDDITFVNGTDETSQNPEVLFTNIGRYDVSLTVSNLAGDSTLTKKSYVTVGGKILPYAEDYEGGSLKYLGWDINNPDGEKTWETDSVIGKDNGKNVAAYINFHDYYYVGPRDQLISPAISFEGFETVYLTFDYAYAQRDNHVDSLIVKISDDCGETWTRVYNNGPDMTEKFVTREPMSDYFIPELATDWSGLGNYGENNPIIDLTNWANKSMIKIMFESYAGYGNNLYIDNIEISNAVGIFSAKNKTNNTFSIYPNPADKIVNIALFKQNEEMEVTITDLNGKELIHKTINSGISNIDISNLTKGLYFIQVRNKKISNTEKLIIE
jgi:PKD repeat protein